MTERISSLVDGELARDLVGETCDSLGDDELRTVERYQLIGALIRGERSDACVRACRDDLAARIGDRIAEEPTWLLRPPTRRRTGAAPRRAPAFLGGFAAAAAIAAVAALVVVPNWLGSPGAVETPLADAQRTAPSTTTAGVDELNSLLVEHGEFTGSAGLNGLLSYAKFVSQDSE